jgi:hypothetical protein
MFLVSDNQVNRHEKICSFLAKEPIIAVLLAAIDFEWTVRRAILALGRRPTKDIRVSMQRTSGHQGYKDVWNEEVKPQLKKTLAEAIPDWCGVTEAFRYRHRLVHGVEGTISAERADSSVKAFLKASTALEEIAMEHDGTLYRRIVRFKERGLC